MKTLIRNRFFVLLAAFLIAVDQILKAAARKASEGCVIELIPRVIRLRVCENTGAAFSLFAGKSAFIALLSIALIAFLLFLLVRDASLTSQGKLALTVLLGGAMGNLIDRVFFGAVTDYIELLIFAFPVFNFADICITLAVAALSLLLFTGKLEKHTGETFHG